MSNDTFSFFALLYSVYVQRDDKSWKSVNILNTHEKINNFFFVYKVIYNYQRRNQNKKVIIPSLNVFKC